MLGTGGSTMIKKANTTVKMSLDDDDLNHRIESGELTSDGVEIALFANEKLELRKV